MSWIDQCKMAFKIKADNMIATEIKLDAWGRKIKRGRRSIMQSLSDESGIPAVILKRWFWEKEYKKDFPVCVVCAAAPIEIDKKALHPARSGLCDACRKLKAKERRVNDD